MFFPSAKIIIKHPSDKNKILLIKRSVNGKTYYEPAGGKVEIDFVQRKAESLEECALREVEEELGITATIERYLGSYYFFWAIDPSKCSSCAVFIGNMVHKDQKFAGNKDTCELSTQPAWITLVDLLDKRICIDESYVGLENIIVSCFRYS